MPTKLNGPIALNKIPKSLIRESSNGNKNIYIDVVPNKNGVDQYGNSHCVTIYNKETKETIYLGNLKSVEFGAPSASMTPPPPSAPNQSVDVDNDLPFEDRPW